MKQFLEELETLSDHPILLLSAYGLVEWAKSLDREEKTEKDKKASKIFDKMNKALGLDKLHEYYQTRINHKLAPTVNELWTAWTYHTTQPFQFSGTRLKHASLCLGSDYAKIENRIINLFLSFFLFFSQLAFLFRRKTPRMCCCLEKT